MEYYLANIWLLIIGFFLLYYAVTDGFDLGVGILCLFSRNASERQLMVQSLTNIWHTNQTWLVIVPLTPLATLEVSFIFPTV